MQTKARGARDLIGESVFMARCPADRMEAQAAARSRLLVTEPKVSVESREIRFLGRERAGDMGVRGRMTGRRSDLNDAAA